MSKYYIYHDVKRCIGCFSCESHCKSKNNLPVGPRFCQIIMVGPKLVNNLPRTANIFMPCFHCEEPWCLKVCPSGAIKKRSADGIVFIEPAACIGCKSCIMACPWGTVQWDPVTNKAIKCDYCKDRLDGGLKPACVTKCLTQCLDFGEAARLPDTRRQRFANAVAALSINAEGQV